MPFDLRGTLRKLKPHKRFTRTMLDTSVYLDVLQARTPADVDELLTYRVCYHSTVRSPFVDIGITDLRRQ